MSHTRSPSQHRPYGLARICHEWQLARSTLYARRKREQALIEPQKRGPKTRYSDEQLTQAIQKVLKNSPWNGEGHRKVWARLRQADIRAGKPRILRLMREAQLLAPQRIRSSKGPKAHDGTIITQSPDQLWGTDATSAWTTQDGSVTVFIAVDHCTAECLGIHAAKPGTRFEALEPIRQGVRYAFGDFRQEIATGLSLRHDHGSQYMSYAFQQELQFLGIQSSPSFVRAPEGNGVAERFIRTLKEQLLWIEPFETVEDLRLALQQWRKQYNAQWLVQRHGHRTPFMMNPRVSGQMQRRHHRVMIFRQAQPGVGSEPPYHTMSFALDALKGTLPISLRISRIVSWEGHKVLSRINGRAEAKRIPDCALKSN